MGHETQYKMMMATDCITDIPKPSGGITFIWVDRQLSTTLPDNPEENTDYKSHSHNNDLLQF